MAGQISTKVLTFSCILLGISVPSACQRASTGTAKSQAKPADQIHWIRYNDSAEGAFTMDVPLGWQVQGGMYRFGYFDVRWEMGVRSLDGKIIIRINDINVPPYALPGRSTGREGQSYIKPQQYQMVVERFQQPKAYAEVYAKHRFGDICKGMTPAASAWSPTLPASWSDAKAPSSSDSVAYSCETTDGPRVATVFTNNALFQGQGYGFWVATPISILCVPDRCGQAQSMTQHMIDSWEKNPQWVEHQNQMAQLGLQRIREGFAQFMQQMQQIHQQFTQSMNQQVSSYYAHQNAQAKQVSSWCDTINGETNVTDPQTGTQFKVFTGPKHNYYENGLGVKINSDVSPGPDFHQLQVNP
jgi:hypothetical protein